MSIVERARRALLLIAVRFAITVACFAAFPYAAHAGIAPTILPLGCYASNGCHYYTLSDVVGYRGDSPQNACDNFAQTKYGYLNPYGKAVPSAGSNAGYQCQVFRGNEIYVNGFGVYIAGAWATSRTCPAHSTLDAASGTCNCDAGYLVDATQTQCVAPVNQVTLTGPSRTKALIAGPAIVQVARVAGASGPAAGVSVTIAVTGGASVSGVTDANGQFAFTYVPPWKPTVDHLKATCSNCANAAEKDITVDPCEVCAPTVGNPLQPASGEKLQTEVDWVDAAPHPLTLARSYRSFGVAETAMGLWSLPWSAAASVGPTEASVQLGEGARVLFRRTADGQAWVADGGSDSFATVVGASYYRRASDGTTYTFDGAGGLAAITQRNGWVMTLLRDSAGRMSSVTNAFGRSIVFAYDAGGRIASATLPDGSRIAYGYDAAARLASVAYPDGSMRAYAYENAQHPRALTGIVDERGIRAASFGYDAAGRATSSQHAGAQAFSVSYSQSGAAQGRVVAGASVDPGIYRSQAVVSDPLGTARTYEWAGGEGRAYLAGAEASGGISAVASRGAGSMPAYERDFAGVTTSYAWDAVRRLKTATTEAAGRPEARSTFTEWHPSFDLPVRVTEAGRVTTYEYDANSNRLSRMEIATGEVDLEGQFDAPGASLTTSETPKVDTGSNRLLGFSLFTTSTNGAQSSSSSTEVKYAVDAVGNMTSDGLRKFVYDSSNRLSKVEAVNGGDAMAYQYLHNALGQRVFKSDALVKSTTDDGKFASGFIGWLKSNFGWLYAPGQTGRARTGLGFVYDEAGNMLAAYGNGSNFAAQQEMEVVWLPQEGGHSIPLGLYKSGRLFAIHADHLGTPRLMTDSFKEAIWQWPYSAFGNNKPSGPLQILALNAVTGTWTQLKATAPSVDLKLRFHGQYADGESNLAYNTWRYLKGDRYTQGDPINLLGGWNRFGYVSANTLMYTDPLGLEPNRACVAACTAAGGVLGGLLGETAGGVGGAVLGGAAGSLIGPAGTLGGATAGAAAGSQVGGPAGAGLGAAAGFAAGEAICPDECSPPVGTQCYEGPDTTHSHGGLRPHYHIYEMFRFNGECRWKYLGGKIGRGVLPEPPAGTSPCSSYAGFHGR